MDNSLEKIFIYLDVDPDFEVKAKYVFANLFRILNLKPIFTKNDVVNNVQIYYGNKFERNFAINIYHDKDAEVFYRQKELYPREKLNYHLFRGEYIPFLFSPSGEIFHHYQNNIIIRKDIISSVFYFLSGWQEYVKGDEVNEENRFKIEDSIQFQEGFHLIPVVDRYCEILDTALSAIFPEQVQLRRWDQKEDFIVTLSHDVDYWKFWDNEHLKKITHYNIQRLKEKKSLKDIFSALYKITFHNIHKKFFFSNRRLFKQIRHIEKRVNANSTFFLLSNGKFEDYRQNYILNRKIRKQIRFYLKDAEIGLHGSPKASHNENFLVKEKNYLESNKFEIVSYRAHYLSINFHKTFSILEKNGIQIDSSLGFWEQVGYRAGISYPFYPFNIEKNRPYKVLEIPLIVMDTTLLSPNAMGLSAKQAYKYLKKMILDAKKHHSHISLLWHNTTFEPIDYPGWGKLYQKILLLIKKEHGLMLTVEKMRERWLKKVDKLKI